MINIIYHLYQTQIKITMRNYFTSTRMTIIDKRGDGKCWRGCREFWNPPHCWWDCKMVPLLWKMLWKIFLQRVKCGVAVGPSNCAPGNVLKSNEHIRPQRNLCVNVPSSATHRWKQPKCASMVNV